ncbi:MAG: hypothetical protein AB2693_19775 [Candidatus Thiodiazotropha sp.]
MDSFLTTAADEKPGQAGWRQILKDHAMQLGIYLSSFFTIGSGINFTNI